MSTARMLAAVHVGPATAAVREFRAEAQARADPGQSSSSRPGVLVAGHPGHEVVGRVVESHSDEFAEGDQVLVLPTGSFAAFVALPGPICVAIPAGGGLGRALMAQELGVAIFGMDMVWPSRREPEGVARQR